MKIIVYTICKNEIYNIKKWYNSIKDEQDWIYVTDTGSTDGTIKKLSKLDKVSLQKVTIDPWRFDIQRNLSLQFVPEDVDICVSLDLDETLEMGWREKIENQWNNTPNFTVCLYTYIHDWIDKQFTIPGNTMLNFKIHNRHNMEWINPVHESIEPMGDRIHNVAICRDIISKHYPSNKKRNYLPLLELQIKEKPFDYRIWYQYGNQLLINSEYEKQIKQLTNSYNYSKSKLELPCHKNGIIDGIVQNQAREISNQYLQICKRNGDNNLTKVIEWSIKQLQEEPHSKESWYHLQVSFINIHMYPMQYGCVTMQKKINNINDSYIVKNQCWNKENLDKLESNQLEGIKINKGGNKYTS